MVQKKKTMKKTAVKRKATGVKRKKALPIPKGYRSITPYLIVNKGVKAIEFYQKVFGAKVTVCMEYGKGKVAHAELVIGDSMIMLADECLEMKALSPTHFKGSPMSIHLYVKDVNAVVKRARAAGAKLIHAVEDKFYGDRNGVIQDPYGYQWCVSTHIEDLTPAQIRKRAAELFDSK